jgi:parallel beta-helix repeat protein
VVSRLAIRFALLIAVAASLGTGASPAAAATVICGQTITVNTTVDNDLTCPSSNGLVVGANGITLDLNGHTIRGFDGQGVMGDNGIVVSGRQGVTVRNGTVTRFEGVGVDLSGSTGSVLRGLTLSNLGPAVAMNEAADDNLIADSELSSFGAIDPVLTLAGDRNVLRGGTASAACPPPVLVTGGDNLVEASRLSHTYDSFVGCHPLGIYESRGGVEVTAGSGNRIVGNTLSDNVGLGMLVGPGATNTLVQGNIANGNESVSGLPEQGGDGIRVESASTTIVGNLADGNSELGIRGVAGVTDGGGNTAQGNADSRQCVNVVCDRSLLGTRAVGGSFSSMSTNVKRASPFVVYFPVKVTALNAYLDGGGAASGSQAVRGLIYRSASGLPTSLVATSSVVTIDAGRPPGFVDLPVGGSPVLQPGVYWLGLHSGATHGVARFAWSSVAGHRRYGIDAFADGASNPFGSALVDDQQISIYASGTYDTGSGSN